MIAASSLASDVDYAFDALVIFSGLLALCLFVAITYFLIKYRASSKVDRKNPQKHQPAIEITWILATLFLFLPLFIWNAKIFFDMYVPPHNAVEINVVAKQWMWKFYRAESATTGSDINEIDNLHLIINQPVRLIMISEDVIHSLFIADFRVKQDVLPGQYTSLWFTPTKLGVFPLLCTQYCGTNHSRMGGDVTVMTAADFDQWRSSTAVTTADEGLAIYQKFQCSACHESKSGIAPDLHGLYGKPVLLTDDSSVIADENYIKESILSPSAQIVKGYKNVMPSFRGQMKESELMMLISYIKSLKTEGQNHQ